MSTMYTPPFDLYEETAGMERMSPDEGRTEEQVQQTTPRDNGDVDEPAVANSGARLQQVLGW